MDLEGWISECITALLHVFQVFPQVFSSGFLGSLGNYAIKQNGGFSFSVWGKAG